MSVRYSTPSGSTIGFGILLAFVLALTAIAQGFVFVGAVMMGLLIIAEAVWMLVFIAGSGF